MEDNSPAKREGKQLHNKHLHSECGGGGACEGGVRICLSRMTFTDMLLETICQCRQIRSLKNSNMSSEASSPTYVSAADWDCAGTSPSRFSVKILSFDCERLCVLDDSPGDDDSGKTGRLGGSCGPAKIQFTMRIEYHTTVWHVCIKLQSMSIGPYLSRLEI